MLLLKNWLSLHIEVYQRLPKGTSIWSKLCWKMRKLGIETEIMFYKWDSTVSNEKYKIWTLTCFKFYANQVITQVISYFF